MPTASTHGCVIRAMIMSEEPLVRYGLRSILENLREVRVVAECDDRSGAMLKIKEKKPEILLMTFSSWREVGLDFLSEVRSQFSDVHVILTGMLIDSEQIHMAIDYGALVLLLSEASPDVFAYAIHVAMSGKQIIIAESAGEQLSEALMRLNIDETIEFDL